MSINSRASTLSNANADVAIMISFMIDDKEQVLLLDTVNDNTLDASSTLTEHPMPSGEMAADHMFREPVTIDISGTFQQINKSIKTTLFDSSGVYLADIEGLFERIKDEGVVCDIVKISTISDSIKFKRRENMVLTSIRWAEKISTVDFTFSFRQVQFVDVQEYTVDIDDQFLPDLTEPEASNFTDQLFDNGQFLRQVVDILIGDGILEQKLWEYVTSTDQYIVWGISAATALILAGVATAFVVISGSTAGIGGLVFGAIIAGIICTVIAVRVIKNIVKTISIKLKYGIHPFVYKKNEKKRNAEAARFAEYLASIKDKFEPLNDKIKMYGIPKDGQQEMMLSVNDEYYVFSFTRNNSTDKTDYDVVTRNFNNESKGSVQAICSSAVESFDQCTSTNCIADFGDGVKAYINFVGDDRSNLSHFTIIVSSIAPEDFTNVIADITTSALRGG